MRAGRCARAVPTASSATPVAVRIPNWVYESHSSRSASGTPNGDVYRSASGFFSRRTKRRAVRCQSAASVAPFNAIVSPIPDQRKAADPSPCPRDHSG